MFRMIPRLRKFQYALLDIMFFQIAFTSSSHIVKRGMNMEIPSSMKESFFVVTFSILSVIQFILLNIYVEDMLSQKLMSYKRVFRICCSILISLVLSEVILRLVNDGYGLALELVITYYIIVALSLVLYRIFYGLFLRMSQKKCNNKKNILFVGRCEEIKEYELFIKEHQYLNYHIVGYVKIDEEDDIVSYIGDIQEIIDIAKTNIIDEVVISGHLVNNDDLKSKLSICRDMGIVITVLFDVFDEVSENTKGMVYSDFPRIKYSDVTLNAGQLFIKRCIDILGAIAGMLIFGISYVIFGPIIKIESKGPILFKQKRVGKNGRVFTIYKYRSMYIDAEERKKELIEQNEMLGYMFKIKNDPRLTKVGKFIRKTSIDELPQFINVLRGDMSLVGTRPPTLDEVSKYEYRHFKRIAVVPGLTGKWQVSGRSDITDFEEVVKMDVDYITKWTVLEDIRIIFRTIKIVFVGRGAR